MKQKFQVPRIDYVVFELIKIDSKKYKESIKENKEFIATQVDTVYLGVLPESFDYSLTGRDSIQQTYSDVFVNKFDFAPERCSIQGSFGDAERLIAGTYMNGWSRLEQFQEDIVRKSKRKLDGTAFYALNYYDFIWRRFGSVNISNWKVNGNSNNNSNLIRYNCDFVITGDLIKTSGTDKLLTMLNTIYGIGGRLDKAITSVNDLIPDTSFLAEIAGLSDIFQSLVSDVTGVVEVLKGIIPAVSNGVKSIW